MLENQEKTLEKCKQLKTMILHLTDEILNEDLSAEQKARLIDVKTELLLNVTQFEILVNRTIK